MNGPPTPDTFELTFERLVSPRPRPAGEAYVVEGMARADATGRLDAARGLLRRLEDRAPGARPAPEADGRLLPVLPALGGLLPHGGLRRGSTVAIAPGGPGAGGTSLLLALLAQASATGAWTAVVGRPELGLVAAAEAGIALERLALVPYPGAELVAVTAALLDGLDVVALACAGAELHAADRQRLAARARQRGAVLVPLGPWPGADVELACGGGEWRGLGGGAGAGAGDGGAPDGGGRLRARHVRVRLRGRGVPPAGRDGRLLLPGVDGRAAAVGAEPVEGPVEGPGVPLQETG